MMRSNIPARRRRCRAGQHTIPRGRRSTSCFADLSAEAAGEGRRSNRPGNSQAKGPRSGDELLESETAQAVSTEGV